MTQAATIRDQLQTLAADTLGWEGPLPDGDLAASLDSVDRLALVVAIEDHWELCFEPEDEDAARTIDDVVAVIRRKLDQG